MQKLTGDMFSGWETLHRTVLACKIILSTIGKHNSAVNIEIQMDEMTKLMEFGVELTIRLSKIGFEQNQTFDGRNGPPVIAAWQPHKITSKRYIHAVSMDFCCGNTICKLGAKVRLANCQYVIAVAGFICRMYPFKMFSKRSLCDWDVFLLTFERAC